MAPEETDQARRQEGALYRLFFDRAADAMLVADDEGRFVAANDAARRLLGEDLVGRTLEDVFPVQDHLAARELWRRFLEEGSQSGAVRLARPDGSLVDLEYRAVAHFRPGRHLSVLRETDLGSSPEERRVESLATLARGLSHNLNNALAGVLLAAEDVRASDPAALGELESAVQRSATLVRRFALFARTSQPSRQPVELLSTLRGLAEERGAGLRVAEGIGSIEIRLDAELLRAALVELLDNASEAMAGEPGRPLLTLDLEDSETGPVACIGVEDRGPGMSPEVRERFLEPFFTTGDEASRAGLGAALAWGAVQALDGSLRCATRDAPGTRVEIRLPIGL